MLHLLHGPPLHVSTVDTGGDRRLGCWDLSYETLSYVIEQYIPHILTRTDIFSAIRKIVKSNL